MWGDGMIKVLKFFMGLIIAVIVGVLSINAFVVFTTIDNIITDKTELPQDIDCIMILGAGIWGDQPSHMLQDRLDEGIRLYKEGVAPKILMSGDHGSKYHDEVNVMKNYAMEKGVPSSDIFMDHAGFSTYESMYRAKDIFEVDKMIVITQKYHLFRAMYIAESFDIETYGANSDPRRYRGFLYREAREVLARIKDFASCIVKPEPTVLGESIPVNGNGDITNDK